MGIVAKKYARKAFFVDAIRVTEENFSDVAAWCLGVVTNGEDGKKFIKVRVFRPAHENQTMANVGDWILHAGSGFKVYTNAAFEKHFESPFKEELPSELLAGVN